MKRQGVNEKGLSYSYEARLNFWKQGTCPYCKGKNVTKTDATRGGTHYTCTNPLCGAENHFSKRVN